MKIAEFSFWQCLVFSLILRLDTANKHKLYLIFTKSTSKIVPGIRKYNSASNYILIFRKLFHI